MSEMGELKLEVGAFGDAVKKLHRKLIEYGLAIPSSEVNRAFFGPGTRDAVIQCQRTHGLPATGIVDERTNAIFGAAPKSDSFQPQSSAPVVPPRTAVPSSAPQEIFGREIADMFAQARAAASEWTTRDVTVNGKGVHVQYPFPSPTDWR